MIRPPLAVATRARFAFRATTNVRIIPHGIANTRHLHVSLTRSNVPMWPNSPMPQPPVTADDEFTQMMKDHKNRGKGRQSPPEEERESFWREWSSSPGFQAALTTIVGLIMVFGGGMGYLQWYKAHVLHRVERAFEGGYDPALELGSVHSPKAEHINRREQPLLDAIFRGEEAGGYYLILGPKGTGKGTMVLDAMRAVHAEGASVCEAHPDLEVFRLRLGKALDFDFFEDWQGSLFSRADPRSAGPSLDVERAMTKLEKVALRYFKKNGRPLVLAFTNIHQFPQNEEGIAILHQLQQRAEAWAGAGLMTMVFTSDDRWPLDKMKKNGSRMRVLSVYDLSARESIEALRHMRRYNLHVAQEKPIDDVEIESDEVLRRVYELVGGRTAYLSRVARASDMIDEAERMVLMEKGWMLSKIGLIPEMDDDVMDEQKWASCSWLLLRHMAQNAPKLDPLMAMGDPKAKEEDEDDEKPDPAEDHGGIDLTPSAMDVVAMHTAESSVPLPKLTEDELYTDIVLPRVTYDDARRLMTRTDFFDGLDHDNIIAIDLYHDVRPESVMILRAAQQVTEDPDFDEMLDQTRDRVDEIEGLHRQSELTVKEPLRATFGRTEDGCVTIDVVGLGGSFVPEENDDNDKEGGDDGDKEDKEYKEDEEDNKRLV
ncbi:uncharacterized protein CcaverHIS019_0509240 [Cutaneotrichosporon cavernicola]|uniref:AAA protein C-terminal winged helix domain-containing protein n=1 Tax=Cutaneotrichosporon cavernicola TaxID=279322 RepID=A0AA48L7F7_9TREE|nr:uncharacterized protein CcaverHIS019_0509240 [Cutaneotrichosporon cavernicola]BEI93296.1 hypothetical protein CcaverHIS019_0509240 [Cutaneotrichosporon cavernicola]BEJ01073.1 hypothetical protein CcaverHIS631_0509300 [Cutaneotrichosporon cavernicola]BEJ08841.1 hypothetical protein CcaverHIS641_0509350 [Cutaneotrichosporon cavernicola]